MIDRKIIALVVMLIAVTGVGGLALLLGNTDPNQVPPPNEPPTNQIDIVTSGDVVLWAESEYWQDFMPSDDPSHPFYCVIQVNITNNGDSIIENLAAIRTTM